MKLSISNIAWPPELDLQVYELMREYDYCGLEIAPTRVFGKAPYEKHTDASAWAKRLACNFGVAVSSIQSIWFGRQENLFGSERERQTLIDYTKKAIDFANTVGCKNLVFGCPRNRAIPDDADEKIGVDFFKEIGAYAANKGTVVSVEANPPIYNTNYINDTASALELIEKVKSDGFLLNLDVGTMICNNESVERLRGSVALIHHIHISEPELKPIVKRKLHKQLRDLLLEEKYRGFVSIEMGMTDNLSVIGDTLSYVREIFGS